MIPYLKMAGTLPGGIAGQITTDSLDDLAIIPGWTGMLDPAYRVGSGIRNRALPLSHMLPTTALDNSQFVTVGSNTMYSVTTDGNKALVSSFALNPSEWTMSFVLRQTTVSATGARDLIRPKTAGTGIGPRISLRTTGQLSVYPSAATTARLTISDTYIPSGTLFLLTVTFSTTAGLHVYVNGALVGSNTSDLSPLNERYGAGEFVLFGNNSGTGELLAGVCGFLDLSLNLSANAGYHTLYNSTLMAKYSIA